MLTSTIPAYVYKQYQDDDDIVAFVAALNAAANTYIAWFASVGLPYYPGLSDDLLDWVAQGIYGIYRPSLVQNATSAIGMLNTEELDTLPLNAYVAPTVTYYDISDDVFKRIITWNFYKGDGKRFCMKWLKRRVMRFLVGNNGLTPNPLDPAFVIGPENTQSVSATVTSGALSVVVNGAYISSLVQLQPNILGIFSSAFSAGILELPLQYTPSSTIITQLTVFAVPTAVSVVGIATTLTTSEVSVSAIGGNGAYTFAWTWQFGGTGITFTSGSASATAFKATGMARGTTLTGTALCTVHDSAGHTSTAVVAVAIQNISAVTLAILPTSYSAEIASSTFTSVTFNANASGGGAPYSVSWSWPSGGAGIAINSPASPSTVLIVNSISPGQTLSGTLQAEVTDAYGQTATATCSVSIQRATQISVAASPTSVSASSQMTPLTTNSTTVSASGGLPPYSVSWTFVWSNHTDGATYAINSPSSATTSITAAGMTAGNTDTGTLQATIGDSLGQQALAYVPVTFTYNPPSPVQHLHQTSGSGTDTAPFTGFVVIEVTSSGGGGEGGAEIVQSGRPAFYGGEGGESGTYARSLYAVTVGQTLNWSLGAPGVGGAGGNYGPPGAGGTASVSSGSLGITTMTCPGGNTGNAPSGGNQVNSTFNSGTAGGLNFAGRGGAAQAGEYAPSAGAGGSGGVGSSNGATGSIGAISFYYYPS